MCRILKKQGWTLIRIKSSHHAFRKQGHPNTVIVPVHGNKDLNWHPARHHEGRRAHRSRFVILMPTVYKKFLTEADRATGFFEPAKRLRIGALPGQVCRSRRCKSWKNGMPATRAGFTGRWKDQDYLRETVAVRYDEQVYFIAASFPASDTAAREQVRQAVVRAAWK
jgi:predicted RNA binding protein YcfA (HicA-like mRNA interferase family)